MADRATPALAGGAGHGVHPMTRVLGIDPGLRITGYACVALAAGAIEPTLLEAGCLRLPARRGLDERLLQLHDDLTALIDECRPQHVAVEKLYAHYAHPRTAILMAHARGVILLAARQHGLDVVDLPASTIKKAVTGFGGASKVQVQQSVATQFRLDPPPEPFDVADAIAIAATCARRLALTRL